MPQMMSFVSAILGKNYFLKGTGRLGSHARRSADPGWDQPENCARRSGFLNFYSKTLNSYLDDLVLGIIIAVYGPRRNVDNTLEAASSLDNSGLRLIMKSNPTRKLSVWQADAPASRVCHPWRVVFYSYTSIKKSAFLTSVNILTISALSPSSLSRTKPATASASLTSALFSSLVTPCTLCVAMPVFRSSAP